MDEINSGGVSSESFEGGGGEFSGGGSSGIDKKMGGLKDGLDNNIKRTGYVEIY